MVATLRRREPFGLHFQDEAPVVGSAPNRADIALFVGFVARRPAPAPPPAVRAWLDANGNQAGQPLPAAVRDWLRGRGVPAWLREQGWMAALHGRPANDLAELAQVPVPIDTWETFDRLFAWEQRPIDGGGRWATSYLGAAVRSFFAQGGRLCYVVRAGDPWPLTEARATRLARLAELIPGYPLAVAATPLERSSWRGVAHLFGLPDVSFVCLPDLADAVGVAVEPLPLPPPTGPGEEVFVECSAAEPAPPADRAGRRLRAPRCDEAGYADWARAVSLVGDLLARQQREVQLVAAVPIPLAGTPAERDLLGGLAGAGDGPLARSLGDNGLASAFVQLAYPWARTPGSANLPEGLESPDAVLVGLLARSALTRGAFRSAGGQPLGDVIEVAPALSRAAMLALPADAARPGRPHPLLERVSLLGPTPGGLALLSDVTTSLSESYRPAAVNRLVAALVRAARRLGEDLVFEAAGERLWARLRESLTTLLTGLLRAGALRGATPQAAFLVRCDRSTMTQNDLDNGRVIAVVQFQAALPIDTITVALALDEGGQVSLVAPGAGQA